MIEVAKIKKGPNAGLWAWKIDSPRKRLRHSTTKLWSKVNGIAKTQRAARSAAAKQLHFHQESSSAMNQPIIPTPSSRWKQEGRPDPHAGEFDIERSQLMMGDLTDDEMANAMFLYDHRNGLQSMAFLQAGKDRIRWLSRTLEKALVGVPRWRPIETAPKTRADFVGGAIEILAKIPRPEEPTRFDHEVVWWEPGIDGGCWWSSGDRAVKPTHWMEIPA